MIIHIRIRIHHDPILSVANQIYRHEGEFQMKHFHKVSLSLADGERNNVSIWDSRSQFTGVSIEQSCSFYLFPMHSSS